MQVSLSVVSQCDSLMHISCDSMRRVSWFPVYEFNAACKVELPCFCSGTVIVILVVVVLVASGGKTIHI